MDAHSLRWLKILPLLLALAVSSLAAAPSQPALAQPDRVTLTLEGFITAISSDGVQVAGVITELDGSAEGLIEGGWAVLTVLPAARFQNGRFEEGDEVLISGRLVADDTLRANRVQRLDDEDEADWDGEDEDLEEDGVRANCPPTKTHPAAAKLAARFDLGYDVIIGWFCQGFGFGEIKLALRISEASGVEAGALLAMKSEGQGWGQVIQSLGMSPSEVNPGLGTGKPEDAGRPDNPGRPADPGSQGQGHGKDKNKKQ